MKNNYKKVILTTMLWTFTALVVLSSLISLIMILAFPKSMGNVFSSLGSNNLASSMYYRAYVKDSDLNNCYKALNFEIDLKNDEKIIEYYEAFVSDKNYSNFMIALKSSHEKNKLSLLEKSAILNEDNYLTNKYIEALLRLEDYDKAWDLALEKFESYATFDLKNQGVFALNQFVETANFNKIYDGCDLNLIDAIEDYFRCCVEIFEDNQSTQDGLEIAYLLALGNRIMVVGQTINAINVGLGDSSGVASIQNTMFEINNTIKGLL